MDAFGTAAAALRFAAFFYAAGITIYEILKDKRSADIDRMRTITEMAMQRCDDFRDSTCDSRRTVKRPRKLARHGIDLCKKILKMLDKMQPEKRTIVTIFRAFVAANWSKYENLLADLRDCLLALDRFLDEQDSNEVKIAYKKAEEELGEIIRRLDHITNQNDQIMNLHTETDRKIESNTEDRKIGRILAALAFHSMYDRYDAVSTADQDTLDWIFEDRGDTDNSPGSESDDVGDGDDGNHGSDGNGLTIDGRFTEWLAAGSGIFHIVGEAVSGKSTLMKHIVWHEETKTRLKTWAGDRELVIADYFIRGDGGYLQWSTMGLIRTLLHGIVMANKGTAEVLFPDIWAVPSEKEPHLTAPLIRKAFHRLSTYDAGTGAGYCYCFFIDGLDEFGNDNDTIPQLVRTLKQLTTEANGWLKICVSSREHPALTYIDLGTDDRHWITMDDFTYHDIVQMVNRRLREHFQGKDHNWLERPNLRGLPDAILNIASGEFVWAAQIMAIVEERVGVRTSTVTWRSLLEEWERWKHSLSPSLSADGGGRGARSFLSSHYSETSLYAEGSWPQHKRLNPAGRHDPRDALSNAPQLWCSIM